MWDEKFAYEFNTWEKNAARKTRCDRRSRRWLSPMIRRSYVVSGDNHVMGTGGNS